MILYIKFCILFMLRKKFILYKLTIDLESFALDFVL